MLKNISDDSLRIVDCAANRPRLSHLKTLRANRYIHYIENLTIRNCGSQNKDEVSQPCTWICGHTFPYRRSTKPEQSTIKAIQFSRCTKQNTSAAFNSDHLDMASGATSDRIPLEKRRRKNNVRFVFCRLCEKM